VTNATVTANLRAFGDVYRAHVSQGTQAGNEFASTLQAVEDRSS
jgi:hypothetical protein